MFAAISYVFVVVVGGGSTIVVILLVNDINYVVIVHGYGSQLYIAVYIVAVIVNDINDL